MYSLLPLQAEKLGFSLAGVGLLLSANRIIRLLSNTWAGLAYERFGSRAPFVFAAALSVITTWLYGAGMGFAVFLLARAGWGVAWSVFRQGGFVAVWAAGGKRKGRLMGSLWGMVRIGSALSVLLGGYLYDRFGFGTAVTAITVLTLFAIPGAMLIRWPHNHFEGSAQPRSPFSGLREGLANSPRRWVLAVGFLYAFMEAVIAVTLSKYIELNFGDRLASLMVGIGTVAGVMLALRYTADFIFAPLLGALSDHFGQPRTIALLTLLILANIVAAVSAPGLWSLLFLALVFFSGSGLFAAVNAAASNLAVETERPHLFVSLFTTSIDSGAAAGPLIAFPMVNLVGFDAVYIAAALMLAVAAMRFWRVTHGEFG
jgi:MFS family permease